MEIESLKELEADLWVFDCDGVLYKKDKEAEKELLNLMFHFIASRYDCDIEEASKIRRDLLKKHLVPHTIMALAREGFCEEEILCETYFKLNFQKLEITFNQELQSLLSDIPGKKVVLTNNHGEYARKVLANLGISRHFTAVYGIRELGLIQKPDHEAFELVQAKMGGKQIVFIDDDIKNVVAADKFGWTTIWIGQNPTHNRFWMPKLK